MTNNEFIAAVVGRRNTVAEKYESERPDPQGRQFRTALVRTKTGSEMHLTGAVVFASGNRTLSATTHCGCKVASETKVEKLTKFASPCEKCFGVNE